MTTLSCRNLAPDCLDPLTATNSQEIQKVFLDHIHAKHPLQWVRFSKQFRAVSMMSIRDRFYVQEAEELRAAVILESGDRHDTKAA